MGAASSVTEPLVGVRYIGPLAAKKDILLNRKGRVWHHGEVLQVSLEDARVYLKHPTVWADANAPWEDRGPIRAATAEDLLGWLRAGDAQALERAGAADLYGLVVATAQGCRALAYAPVAGAEEPLRAAVPLVARALLLGPERLVREQLGLLTPVLLAVPALLDEIDEVERTGQGRKGLLGFIEELHGNLDRALGQGDDAQTDLFVAQAA